MRTGKILICDSVFAILMIFAMSSCEQAFNSQKVAKVSNQKIMSTAVLCKKF